MYALNDYHEIMPKSQRFNETHLKDEKRTEEHEINNTLVEVKNGIIEEPEETVAPVNPKLTRTTEWQSVTIEDLPESQANTSVVFAEKCANINNRALPSLGLKFNGKSAITNVTTDIGITNHWNLLIDTGAEMSLIQKKSVDPRTPIDSTDVVQLQGAWGGQEQSMGAVIANLGCGSEKLGCKFQVIPDSDTISMDGLLGRDALTNRALLDFQTGNMIISPKDGVNTSTFSMKNNEFKSSKWHFQINKPRTKRTRLSINPKISDRLIQNYTKGAEMICKMGYREGQGLGASLQGITVPIQAAQHKSDRLGLGAQLIKNYKIEAYDIPENDIMSIQMINHTVPRVRKLHLETEPGSRITVGPREERIVEIRVNSLGDQFCPAQVLGEGVFLSNTILRPKNGIAYIGAINTNLHEITFQNFKPKLEPLERYKLVRKMSNQPVHRKELKENRYLELMSILSLDTGLNMAEKDSLATICRRYVDIFHLPGDKLTYTSVKEFFLPMQEGEGIVNKKQYRIPQKHRAEITTQIKNLLENDIIEPSTSPYNSPVLLVPKKGTDKEGNKKYRLCVDYREINKISQSFSFPLPRIEDIIDRLGQARYYSTLDLSQGFHQVRINKEDREKTAFSTDLGHYQYKRCPFGLKNIPGFFQSLLNGILTGLQGERCFVYLDDVVIFAKDLQEHEVKLEEIFQRFRSSNLKLNPEKCKFLQKEVTYLGHHCCIEGIRPDDRLIQSVRDFPQPKTVKQVQSFLGLANYYRKFIEGFSRKAGSLYQLLKKEDKFNWNPACEESFETLKLALTTTPVLVYPDFNKEFTITTDASGTGYGAILEQEGRVVAYASRTLRDAEHRWSATELELGAVVFGCRTFRFYILGRKTKIFSDHMPLRGTIKLQEASHRIVRLQQRLAEYDLEIVYKKGRENGNADCLSRLPPIKEGENRVPAETQSNITLTPNKITSASKTKNVCLAVTRGQLKEEGEGKLLTEPRKEDKTEGEGKSDRSLIDDFQSKCDNSCIDLREGEEDPELVIEEEQRRAIIWDNHDSILAGHSGINKTYSRIRQKWNWPGMRKEVENYVSSCKTCQLNKVGKATKMPLVMTDVAELPFEKVYVDVVGPLPITKTGNKYILSMVDDLTKFVEFAPMGDQTANTVAETLFENILCRYNIPRSLVTDNGTNFVGNVFHRLCKLLGITKLRTTAYHPQSNSVERQHSTLGDYLRCFTQDGRYEWDQLLRTAAHTYNNSIHISTGFTPMELLFGYSAEMPSSWNKEPEPLYTYDDYVQILQHKLRVIQSIARKKLFLKKTSNKTYYDRRVRPLEVKAGDSVFLRNMTRNSKLNKHWLGPFQVKQTRSGHTVDIEKGGKVTRVHRNLLKGCRMLA